MAVYVVDFQAFKTLYNEYLLKEVAIVNVHTDAVYQWTVRPHTSYYRLTPKMQSRVRFLTDHVHGIPWCAGYIDERDVIELMQNILKNASSLYIKGTERVKYLANMLRMYRSVTVFDINGLEESTLQQYREKISDIRCKFDSAKHKKLRCALEQATRYRDMLRREFYYVSTY